MLVNNTNNKRPDEHINGLRIKTNKPTSLDRKGVAVPTSQDYYFQLYVVCQQFFNYTYSNHKGHCVNHFQDKRYLKYLLPYVPLSLER